MFFKIKDRPLSGRILFRGTTRIVCNHTRSITLTQLLAVIISQ